MQRFTKQKLEVPRVHGLSMLVFLSAATLAPSLHAQKTWIEQGPGPIVNGQEQGLAKPTNPVSGGVNAIATVPGDRETVYVAAVNGGV